MTKRWILTALLFLPALAGALVPNAYVSDIADVLNAEEEISLDTKISNYEVATGNEIAILTIPNLGGDVIENVAQKTFTEWGIGKADKNNGVLILVSVEDRQMRIHTGYGVEGDLPDLATYYIQQEVMVPAFREGQYYAGLDGAVDRIIASLGGENVVPEGYGVNPRKATDLGGLFFFVFIIFEILISMLARSKSWWGGGVLGGVIGGGIIWYFGLAFLAGIFAFIVPVVIGLIVDYFVSKSYGAARAAGTYPWWMGRGGGGSGGGGFGGFGGGMSGGGGSSSRW